MRLATLASEGLIPGVTSIYDATRMSSFRSAIISAHCDSDWAQSAKVPMVSCEVAIDDYTTHNDLVQQGTLPVDRIALTHNNYLSMVVGNQHL